jgi:hypothetical protein
MVSFSACQDLSTPQSTGTTSTLCSQTIHQYCKKLKDEAPPSNLELFPDEKKPTLFWEIGL